MRRFRESADRGQISLFPPSIEEYVGEDDATRYIDELVENYEELESVEQEYSYRGRPGYSPRMLSKLLLYGKLRGISSSRELCRACKENVRFMYLVSNERPDFRTISDFRKKYIEVLGGLLRETVKIGLEEGIITLEHVSIDGTKVKANASGKSFKSPEKLEEILLTLEESLEEDIKSDEAEDQKHGEDDGEPKLPKSLRGRKELAERIKSALSRHAEEESLKESSTTDPDASFMRSKDGKHPCYNGQAAVDAASHMVVGAYVTSCGADQGELTPMLEEIKQTNGQDPKEVSADKGYRASEGLVELEKRDIVGTIPLQEANSSKFSHDDFVYDEEEDEYTCPAGQTLAFVGESRDKGEIYKSEGCLGCKLSSKCLVKVGTDRTLTVTSNTEYIQRMKHHVQTEAGKAAIRIRAQTAELPFAWLKHHKKTRQFVLRGLEAVNNLWKFEMAALNIQRLINIKMQKQAAT